MIERLSKGVVSMDYVEPEIKLITEDREENIDQVKENELVRFKCDPPCA